MLYCLTTMERDPLHLGIVESDLSGPVVATLGLDNEELNALQETINHQEAAIVAADKQQRRSAVAPKIAKMASAGTMPHQASSALKKPHQTSKETDEVDSEEKLDVACRSEDPELFFSDGKMSAKQAEAAKAVCARCKVIKQCLDYALKEDIRHGVWGGKTPDERSIMKLAHRRVIN